VTERDKDLVHYRLARAYETLEDARILANKARWNACVNRLYYACFYAVSALLVRDGLSSSKHAGIRSLFNRQYVKAGKIPKDLAEIYNHSCPKTVFRENLKMSSFWEIVVLPQATKSQGNKEDGNNDTLCKPFQSTGCAI